MRGTLRFSGTWSFVFVGAFVAFAQTLLAQPEAEEFELVTYEVGGLIIDIHDHPYNDSLQRKNSATAGEVFGANNPTSQQLQLVQYGGGARGGLGGGGAVA